MKKIILSNQNQSQKTVNTMEINQDELKLFIVEEVSVFKIRYAIRAKSLEHAYDVVASVEADGFEQEHISANVFGGHEVTEDDFLNKEITDDIVKSFSDERKLEYVHTIDYSD